MAEASSSSSLLSSSNSQSTGAGVAVEKSVVSSPPKYKKHIRVPKKIHKSEREKLKREQLNDLFLDLGLTLEPTRQNNSKASILNDTIKILRALIAQVDTLRNEHFTLLNESKYVTLEKDELIDENNALAMEIEKIQTDMSDRTQPRSTWRTDATEAIPSLLPQPVSTPLIQPPSPLAPLLIIPLGQDPSFASCLPPHNDEQAVAASELALPSVRRPHARYPTPMDSWTLEVLTQQPNGPCEVGSPLVASKGEEEEKSLPKELKLSL